MSRCYGLAFSTDLLSVFAVEQLLLITHFQIKFIWLINFAYYTTNKAINSPKKKINEEERKIYRNGG